MTLVIKDRVKETTTTTGTGTYTLAGAEVGFQSFSTIGNGNTTYYAVTYNNDWEVGIGTYTSSGTTLARTTILSSSNSNNAVNWSSGEKSVFVTQPSSKASFLDASGNLNLSGNIVVSGTVDGRDVAADGTTADNALPKAGGTMSGDINGNGNKVLFANVYSQVSDLPSASTYHGMFAHVHATGKAYYAHAGNWIVLANDADKLNLSGGTLTGNASFGDNNKAIFGTGSDLEIFHNGSNSYITDAGQGKLILSTNGTAVDVYDNANGHTMAQFTNNGSVSLSYQGSTKIATTATGIDVTGNIAVSGTVDGRDIATNIPASLGTAGQVLTVNSGASAGEWATPAGGSPDLFDENYTTGTKPSATGANAIATGKQATATGADAFGHGVNADASGQYSVSFGVNSEATGVSAIAMGRDSVATGSQSFAGTNSRANGQHCTAFSIGNNSTSYGAGGQYSVAIGKQSKTTTTTTDNVAIGINAISNVTGGVSIAGAGYPVLISNVYSLPTADGSANQVLTTNGSGVLAFADAGGGGGADLYAANESSPSAQPSATGANAISIGDSATSAGADGVAIGLQAFARAQSALGLFGDAQSTESICIGKGSAVTADGAVQLGRNGYATATDAVSLGKSRASGANSFAAAIANNTSSYGATSSFSVAIGNLAKSTGNASIAIGGEAVATTSGSLAIGYQNEASSFHSVAIGRNAKSVIRGKHAYGTDQIYGKGEMQAGLFIMLSDTTDATSEALTTNNGTAASNNQVVLPNNSAYTFSGTIVAREKASEGTDVGAWEVKGIIRREANAGTTVLVNSVINEFNAPTGWAVALTADTTLGCLKVAVTGVASTNIRWVATIKTSEVTYA